MRIVLVILVDVKGGAADGVCAEIDIIFLRHCKKGTYFLKSEPKNVSKKCPYF